MTTSSGRTVIAVDDNPENLMILEAVLESADYFFLAASNGPECISLALRSSPRLVLVDIQMPDMDGFETCRRLRGEWSLRRTPIAFLTASKSPEDVRKGLAAGGNDFILKPFDPAKLLARAEYWTTHPLAA